LTERLNANLPGLRKDSVRDRGFPVIDEDLHRRPVHEHTQTNTPTAGVYGGRMNGAELRMERHVTGRPAIYEDFAFTHTDQSSAS
jgi:hypothetical protein